jgi:hypothetical protein
MIIRTVLKNQYIFCMESKPEIQILVFFFSFLGPQVNADEGDLYLVQADQDDGPNSQVAKVRLINRAISI